MDLGLKDKIALVTASTRGLGFATAQMLAAEGARVVINGRDPQKLNAAVFAIKSSTRMDVLPLPGDVSEPTVPARLVEETLKAFGGLDVLVTNSGGPKPGLFETMTDADWQNAVDLCLMAHVRLIRAALPALKKSGSASVLAIQSISVKQPIQNLVLSNSVRAASVGLIKSLSLELGSLGIRFNSILPSSVDTERITELAAARAHATGTSVEEEKARMSAASPMGRIATPDEFARAAVFLVSPAASYLTGVMLPLDGGTYKGTY
jgi:3-oxoacyl-[acyl-carrier protein] reductase